MYNELRGLISQRGNEFAGTGDTGVVNRLSDDLMNIHPVKRKKDGCSFLAAK